MNSSNKLPGKIGPMDRRGVGTLYAGFWRRVLAFCVDCTVFFSVGFVVILAVAIGYFRFAPEHVTAIVQQKISLLGAMKLFSIIVLIKYSSILLLLSGFESSRLAGTPGKLLCGMRVVTPEGRPIGLLQALVRNVAKLLLCLPIVKLLFVVQAFNGQRQALHDFFASTIVEVKPQLLNLGALRTVVVFLFVAPYVIVPVALLLGVFRQTVTGQGFGLENINAARASAAIERLVNPVKFKSPLHEVEEMLAQLEERKPLKKAPIEPK